MKIFFLSLWYRYKYKEVFAAAKAQKIQFKGRLELTPRDVVTLGRQMDHYKRLSQQLKD